MHHEQEPSNLSCRGPAVKPRRNQERVQVRVHRPPGARTDDFLLLLLTTLQPYGMNEEGLRRECEEYGTVEDVRAILSCECLSDPCQGAHDRIARGKAAWLRVC